ncbi:MAG: hypothetical protein JNK32_06690 [Anaerolineales bacterium]|nr:hypothetical protein [Anaerolineales bacterium]
MKLISLMFESMLVAWYQVREAFEEGGLKNVLRQRFFWKRKATPVVMGLLDAAPTPGRILQDFSYQFVEIKLDHLRNKKWIFSTASRGVKASRNIKKGWRGFALVMKNQVVGDVWCVIPCGEGIPIHHSDLGMLGIPCGKKDAYAFDMYISPEHRGENLAAPFHRSLHNLLRTEGCSKVYGFYWDDNLPALWMHRIMKFKELPKRQVTRFLFYMKSEFIPGKSNHSSQGQHVS